MFLRSQKAKSGSAAVSGSVSCSTARKNPNPPVANGVTARKRSGPPVTGQSGIKVGQTGAEQDKTPEMSDESSEDEGSEGDRLMVGTEASDSERESEEGDSEDEFADASELIIPEEVSFRRSVEPAAGANEKNKGAKSSQSAAKVPASSAKENTKLGYSKQSGQWTELSAGNNRRRDEVDDSEGRQKSKLARGTRRQEVRAEQDYCERSEGHQAAKHRPPVRWIKRDKYSAAVPLESYISHFEAVALYNDWEERDKAAYLKASLSGVATQLLWDSGCQAEMTYEELVEKLRARFGAADHREKYACQLRTLRRQASQPLQELYNEVRRLMALAYPHSGGSELNDILARDAFLSALGDRELELRIRDKDPQDLDTAFKAAVRIESYLQAYEDDKVSSRPGKSTRERADRYEEARSRHIGAAESGEENQASLGMARIQQQLDQLMKEQMEMSKEFGRHKLLSEQRTVDRPISRESHRGSNQGGVDSKGNIKSCFVCGDPTHFARNCPDKRPQMQRVVRTPTSGRHGSVDVTGQRATEPVTGGERTIAAPNQSQVGNNPNCKHVKGYSAEQLDRAAYLPIRIGSEIVEVLLDTGSEVCLFPSKFSNVGRVEPLSQNLLAANGTAIEVLGAIQVPAKIGRSSTVIRGILSNQVTEIILGLTFLREQNAVWYFSSACIALNGEEHQLKFKGAPGSCRQVKLTESVELPPRSEKILTTYMEYTGRIDSAGEWATKPEQIAPGVLVARILLPHRSLDIPVRVMNVGNSEVKLQSGTVIAGVEPVTTAEPNKREDAEMCERQSVVIENMLNRVHPDVGEEGKEMLRQILTEYKDAFSFSEDDIGHTSIVKHEIDTGEARPVRQRLRQQTPAHQAAIGS